MKNYIVFDIGGTFIKWAIINDDFKILFKDKFPTQANKLNGKQIIELIAHKINEVKSKYKPFSVGISTPGAVDTKKGIVLGNTDNFIDYVNINVRKIIKQKTGLNTYLTNDGNCAVLGEFQKGSLVNQSNAFMITVGTGIGGGLIVNKKLVIGDCFWAAEIGKTLINNKEWEEQCSTRILLEKAKKYKVESGEDFFKLLPKSQPLQSLYDEFLDLLASGIMNIFLVFNPTLFAIGGGISENKNFSFDLLNKKLRQKLPLYYPKQAKVVRAKLGNDANLIGAAYLAKNKIT